MSETTYHRCCCCQAGQRQSCRREREGWRGWRGGGTRVTFLSLPFLLKFDKRIISSLKLIRMASAFICFSFCILVFCKIFYNCQIRCIPTSVTQSLSCQGSFRDPSVIIVRCYQQPWHCCPTTPASLDQSERATVANRAPIG